MLLCKQFNQINYGLENQSIITKVIDLIKNWG